MKTTSGIDHIARALGGGLVGETGTATSVTTSSLTNTGASFPTNNGGYAGQTVVVGTSPLAYGVILSNTGTALTIDKWYVVGTPGGSPATVTGTPTYAILPGGTPCYWIAFSTTAGVSASDTTLAGEVTAAGLNTGLSRQVAAYAHTPQTSTFTLTKTFTSVSGDGGPLTLQKIGVFNAQSGGVMLFETAITSPPSLVAGDQITITETCTIS